MTDFGVKVPQISALKGGEKRGKYHTIKPMKTGI